MVLYYIISYLIYYIILNYIISTYHISYHIILYYIISYHILYYIVSYIILYYITLYCIILYYIISYNNMGPQSYMGSVVNRNVVMRRISVNLSMLKALNYSLCCCWTTLLTAKKKKKKKKKQVGSRGNASDLYSRGARFTFRSSHGLVPCVHFWTSTVNGQLWSSEHFS